MRMKPEARKEDILAAALRVAERHNYAQITREQVAREAGVAGGSVHYHFGTMGQLRRDLMRLAVRVENLKVIAQGLVAGDPRAQGAPEAIRRRALDAAL